MDAPTAEFLVSHSTVQQAMEEAWMDSFSDDRDRRHEEGGWVYVGVDSGQISVRRSLPGGQASLDLSNPPIVEGSVIVATFHTHPNPTAEGWFAGPSDGDTRSAWHCGVPCLIRADDGIHTTGPGQRRGGLSGQPGFPE